MLQKLLDNVEIVLPENGLQQKLELAERENRPLIIKLGFDPTAPDLHLGHAVVLKKLREFQDLGHQVVILVGSFTARIGDPSGKNKARPPLSEEQVEKNAETYIAQLAKILDMERARIVFNSEWLDRLPFSDVLQMLSRVTVAQLLHRHDFNKRFTDNSPIAMHELVYPILQGFDSVQMQCDIEMGGTDQLFNCTMGRQLQESYDRPGQIVMCLPLLRGTDGKEKMSKSLNNIIGLTDLPNDMYGKTMSIPDALISDFIRLTTSFSAREKKKLMDQLQEGINPMIIKKTIAANIVEQYHGQAVAENANTYFEQQFQQKHFFENVFTPVSISQMDLGKSTTSLVALCTALHPDISKTAIRRLIEDGAVYIDNEKQTDPNSDVVPYRHMKIRIGKKSYYQLVE